MKLLDFLPSEFYYCNELGGHDLHVEMVNIIPNYMLDFPIDISLEDMAFLTGDIFDLIDEKNRSDK